MLYSLYNIDNANTDIRSTKRPEHRAYLARYAEQIAFAGPLLGADGTTPTGSLLVMEFASQDDVDAFIANEPYAVAGLYASISVRPFVNLWPQKAGFPA
jgi:uncharacterized protein YciI